MKFSVYIAVSLDGFIAREDGRLDWLPGAEPDSPPDVVAENGEAAEDYGFHAFMETVDVLVMGRKTFEKVLSLGAWHYGDTRVIVLSSSPVTIPPKLAATVEHRSSSPSRLKEELTAAGVQHAYVDGGVTIQRFLKAGLVDQLIITRIPVLIGNGIPLFGPLEQDIPLRHRATLQFPSGFVQSRYEIA
ncbi:dihydrofolate reductase family protein [Lignipirellula cremea]|uniref:Dihydrofolate reductase n=1 Tax=Lignipirellula cremea TaxID=2528010 RepID=A0A518DX62_9BACT|nr:dihydrofolate reductase family protein [Lignipirellula cremea]QDU96404.1 Dihydrofolate reductase [Lignipirellula cremea]